MLPHLQFPGLEALCFWVIWFASNFAQFSSDSRMKWLDIWGQKSKVTATSWLMNWYLKNAWRDFHYIWHKPTLGLKDEPIRFRAKSQSSRQPHVLLTWHLKNALFFLLGDATHDKGETWQKRHKCVIKSVKVETERQNWTIKQRGKNKWVCSILV